MSPSRCICAQFCAERTVVGLTPGCHREHQKALGARHLDLVEWLKQIDFSANKFGLAQSRDKQHKKNDLSQQGKIRVVLHHPCSVQMQPNPVASWRALLPKIDGVEYVELDANVTCCGAGGSYRFDQAKRSAKLGDITAMAIQALKPDLVLSANVGCLAQIRTHLQHNKDQSNLLEVMHPLVFALSESR